MGWLSSHRFDDPEVQKDIKFLPYKVVNKDGKPYIQVRVKGETKVFSPEEISAMILTKMKETAEAYLGKKIKDAVVTVPGMFAYITHVYYWNGICLLVFFKEDFDPMENLYMWML